VKPTEGHAFASYSWAGFTGVVSGLNVEGLSVTINASKSDLPTGSKTPISLLAREILQYASTIEEAVAIAKKRQTFVSETLLISSKKDGRAALIEKSPTKVGVYDPDESVLVCANHYQSAAFQKDPINKANIKESDSHFRFERMNELIALQDSLGPMLAARILRDQKASQGDTLGMGNPRAINQLIAHHSVIIQPESERFFISTNDYQLGAYIGYDLKEVFTEGAVVPRFVISPDPFLKTKAYASFQKFRATKMKISSFVNFGDPLELSAQDVAGFIASNGESYVTYEMLGRYYLRKEKPALAKKYFKLALEKEVASAAIRKELGELIAKCN
jgi:hypothetical protein